MSRPLKSYLTIFGMPQLGVAYFSYWIDDGEMWLLHLRLTDACRSLIGPRDVGMQRSPGGVRVQCHLA